MIRQNFQKKLENLLKTDTRFLDSSGELFKRSVIDKAWKLDHDLIRLLLSDKDMKLKFFDDLSGTSVFNHNTFIDYVSDKNFLSNSYTRFKNKMSLSMGDETLNEFKGVSLVWPYKDCVLEGGQTKEDQKSQKEIFFNEVLAEDEINRFFDPKILTNWKRYSQLGEEKVTTLKRTVDGVICENFVVKGNNLSTLHTLKSQFQGQVKLIYMDPPFNTRGDANTFLYNNGFNHATWLTFMKNRLEVARDILSDNGIAVIAIDHEELLYLGVLADEIFSRNNRIGIISVQTNPGGRSDAKFFATSSEFFLVYAKDVNLASINDLSLTKDQKKDFKLKDEISYYRWMTFQRGGSNSTPRERPNLCYPIFYNESKAYIGLERTHALDEEIIPLDSNRNKRVWRQSKERFKEALEREDIKIEKKKGKYNVFLKDRIKEGRKPKTIWIDPKYDASAHGTKVLKDIFGQSNVFSYPKSKHLIKDIIKITTSENDMVLDFFAGSGTTAEAILELNEEDQGNRKFILCEQMDYIQTVTVPRIMHTIQKYKKDDFIYCELMKYNEVYMDKIQEASSSDELLSLWKDISENSFLNWYVNEKMPEDAIQNFKDIGKSDNGLDKQKKLLTELLNKNQLYVHLSEMDDEDFHISQEDKTLNRLFFNLKEYEENNNE